MGYSSNLLDNSNLEQNSLDSWLVDNVSIGTIPASGEKYFKLGQTASMQQTNNALAFLLQPLDCKVGFTFRLTSPVETDDSVIKAYAMLKYFYEETDVDVFMLPLIESFSTESFKTDGVWYTLESKCLLKTDAILQRIELSFATNNVDGYCLIRDIYLQRNLDPVEEHNNTANPHNLPLAISVGQHGIKAVLTDALTHEAILDENGNEEVMFWLRNDGSAYLDGEIHARSGVFGTVEGKQILINEDGTVTIPMLTVTGLNDYTTIVDKWKVPGSTTIDGANIETGTVAASKLKTEELIVGKTVQMGTDAIITWENLTDEVKSVLGQPGPPGPPGPQGPPGDPAAANIPAWVSEWNSGATVIAGGYILAPQIFLGHGGQITDGVKIDEDGIISYNNSYKSGFSLSTLGTLELYNAGVIAAEMLFDVRGAGTPEEDEERVFIGSKNGYALKIQTDDANMSIVAGGSIGQGYKLYLGDVVFMGTVEGAGGTAVFG